MVNNTDLSFKNICNYFPVLIYITRFIQIGDLQSFYLIRLRYYVSKCIDISKVFLFNQIFKVRQLFINLCLLPWSRDLFQNVKFIGKKKKQCPYEGAESPLKVNTYLKRAKKIKIAEVTPLKAYMYQFTLGLLFVCLHGNRETTRSTLLVVFSIQLSSFRIQIPSKKIKGSLLI